MRLRPALACSTALAACLWAGAREASACSCFAIGPPCQNAFQVDAVFTGRVAAITPLPEDPASPGDAGDPGVVRVDFADVETYLGQHPRVTSIVTETRSTCAYPFKRGERYVVYARQRADGAGLETSICSRTRTIAEAGEDLRFLQTLDARVPARARVSGTITHWERELSSGQPIEVGPVSDVLITVRGSSNAFHATTDRRGHYEVLVPPGDYEITPSPAAPFATFRYPQSMTLRDPRACFVADFGVNYAGRIRGVVRGASGEAAAGVSVQVMAAEDAGKRGNVQTLRASSDTDGRFEFQDVSPGRYLVGVDLTRRMETELVFPPTFHPGTGDPAVATVVQLKGGEERELEPLVLPAPRPSHQLTGIVVFRDGIPVSGASVSLWDGVEPWRQVGVAIVSGSDGAFSFLVHDGLSYVARVSFNDEQRRQFQATAGPFVVGPGTPPLKVTLDR